MLVNSHIFLIPPDHYNDVIMGAMAYQITSLTIVYSSVYSGADQRKHQSSASLAFVRRIHRWPVNSPHKEPVTRKMFPFDDVIMSVNHWIQKRNWVQYIPWIMHSWRLDVLCSGLIPMNVTHDDVIKWKHFPRYWPFVRGIHRSPVKSLHKGQWRGTLMFSLICARMNGWVNNCEAGDLRRLCAHYDVTVMTTCSPCFTTETDRSSFWRNIITDENYDVKIKTFPFQCWYRNISPHASNASLKNFILAFQTLWQYILYTYCCFIRLNNIFLPCHSQCCFSPYRQCPVLELPRYELLNEQSYEETRYDNIMVS